MKLANTQPPYPAIYDFKEDLKRLNYNWYHYNWVDRNPLLWQLQAENFKFFDLENAYQRTEALENEMASAYDKHDARKVAIFLADLREELDRNIDCYLECKIFIDRLDFEGIATTKRKDLSRWLELKKHQLQPISTNGNNSSIATNDVPSEIADLENQLNDPHFDLIYSRNWFKLIYNQSVKIVELIKKYTEEEDRQWEAMNTKPVLNLDEACIYLGMKKSYIYKLTSKGILPYSKPNGKTIQFDRAKLNAWLLSNPSKSLNELKIEAATYISTSKGRTVKKKSGKPGIR